MSAIRLEGLRKTYGAVRALDGLDLTVEAGTVFGFLGPNGAGKTTTLRILTGLATATAGRAWVAGVEAQPGRTALAARVGYLAEAPAFYGWMSPRELLDHVGRLFGLAAKERKARSEALLEQVGLAQAARRRIAGFSRGMQQRLGLAQALINRPEVLFLDEPVSALDPVGRKEVLDLIEGLRGKCTVFMSTHILADVERVCDAVGIIAHGRLVIEAPREALLAQYAIPAFELAVDAGAEVALRDWADKQRALPWVEAVTMDGRTARLLVKDVAEAKRALLPSAVGAGLALTRFEMMTPSLEDIFLRLVGQAGD